MAADYGSLIEPVKGKRVFDEVSNKLKELIFTGELKPGQRLPSENALAKHFQVGRQSIREALRLLELSGFISVKVGVKGGPIIEGTMLSKISRLFLDAFKFDRVSIQDLIIARKAIEASVLDAVFKNGQKSDIAGLREIIVKARETLNGNRAAIEENMDFHRLLAKASRNYVYFLVIESILAVLSDFRSKYTKIDVEQSKRVTDLHEQILDAIVARKKRKAAALLKEDLSNVSDLFVDDVAI